MSTIAYISTGIIDKKLNLWSVDDIVQYDKSNKPLIFNFLDTRHLDTRSITSIYVLKIKSASNTNWNGIYVRNVLSIVHGY